MAATPDTRPVRVLVADDHAINRQLAKTRLGALGVGVDVVETGREAVEAIMRTEYDLVLMDCHMPELDGWEATAEVRRSEGTSRRTPIVALTASYERIDHDLCLQAGADEVMFKPLSESDLLLVLDRYTKGRTAPAIDTSRIEALRAISAALVPEVIGMYLASGPGEIAAIRAAVEQKDAAALAAAAHHLRSGSANLGASTVLEICIRLEELGRSGSVEGGEALVGQLGVEFERARRKLQRLRES